MGEHDASDDERLRRLDAELRDALVARAHDRAATIAWERFSGALARQLRHDGVRDTDVVDALQNVFARVVRDLPRFDGTAVGPWLFTIADYEARSWRKRYERARRNDQRTPGCDWAARGADPGPEELDRAEEREELGAAVDEARALLRDPVDAMIFASIGEALPTAAVADAIWRQAGVRLSVGAVRVRRHRIRNALAERLGKRGFER